MLAVYIRGKLDQIDPFLVEVNGYSSSSPVSLTYWGLEDQVVADIKGALEQQVILNDPPPMDETTGKPKRRVGVAPNHASEGSNVVLVRVTGTMPFTLDTLVHREEKEDDEPDVKVIDETAGLISGAVDDRLSRFSSSFERVSGSRMMLYGCDSSHV